MKLELYDLIDQLSLSIEFCRALGCSDDFLKSVEKTFEAPCTFIELGFPNNIRNFTIQVFLRSKISGLAEYISVNEHTDIAAHKAFAASSFNLSVHVCHNDNNYYNLGFYEN